MSKYNLQIFLFSLIGFISCNDEVQLGMTLNEADLKEINLSSKKHEFREFMDPWKLDMAGDHLIVLEDRRISAELPLIHIVNIDDWSYFNSKGVIGFGPGEIPSADLLEPGFDDETFFVYSGMEKMLSKYSIKDSSRYAIQQFKQPDKVYTIINMYTLMDSSFIGISTNDSNRIITFDKEGNRLDGYGEWETGGRLDDFSNFNHFILNSGWFKGDRKQGLYVNACLFRDRLEIFDFQSKTFKFINGPDLELPTFENYGPNIPLNIPISNPFRYRDVSFSSKHIYALYGGINEKRIRETGEIAKKIFVFSHEGEPIAKFNLDRSIQGLVINEKKGEIYGLTTDEDPGIAVFKIPLGFL
jgi:hypothetical protein